MSTQPPPDFIPDEDMPDFISDEEMAQLGEREDFGLGTATGIGAVPASQRRQIPAIPGLTGSPIDLPFSAEDAAEALPAAAAGGATLLATRHPGVAATAGGIAGEAARQLFRRSIGAPAATGIAQRNLGLDPDSPGAAVAGMAGESAASVAGVGASKLLKAISGFSDRSSRRSILNILQPRTASEKADAMRLADVTRQEGLVPPLSGRARQIARAEQALSGARDDSEALAQHGIARGQLVEAGPVLRSAIDEIPPALPGGARNPVGETPATGYAIRRTAKNVASDVAKSITATTERPYIVPESSRTTVDRVVSSIVDEFGKPIERNVSRTEIIPASVAYRSGGTKVPLEAAISERRRLDDLLAAMYEAGKEQAPVGTRSIQAAADAWRHAIGDSFPELGKANLRQSDLIHITKMMRRTAVEAERTGGAGSSLAEAGALGAGAAGRMSIPAMLGARALVTAAPFASLSAAGKRLFAKLSEGGAHTAQLWIRAADAFGLNTTTEDGIRERNRKAQRALQSQAQGVVEP